ncbi:ABC transporter ATP-binding protein [Leptothrix sp. BB-4]
MGQVTLRGIRKSYDKTEVIKGIDLDVRDGEFLVFVGPSGCGKSTTLRMIAGLESITTGDLLIDGERANDRHPADRGAAMVFQSYALYPHMTVAENMGFSLRMAGVSKAERAASVGRAAEILRMTDLLARYPKELSGGQRQRVAIGRAIVRKPKVFLFDEPLSNLDAALRVNMRIELSRLHAELGSTMIYVTHDQVEAMTMGDRIAVFNQGIVEQLGAPLDLYNRPANTFVATFLGAPRINLIDRPAAEAVADAAAAHQQLWAALTGAGTTGVAKARRIGLRPEHLHLRPAGEGVPAEVVLAEHLGDVSIVHLRVAGVAELLSAKVAAVHSKVCAGQTVGLVPDSAWALGFDDQGRCLS